MENRANKGGVNGVNGEDYGQGVSGNEARQDMTQQHHVVRSGTGKHAAARALATNRSYPSSAGSARALSLLL